MQSDRQLNPTVERLSVAEIRTIQERRVLDQVAWVYGSNPFYRRLYDAAGCSPDRIRSINDFYDRVPTISKPDLLRDQLNDPPFGTRAISSEVRQVLWSSGTAGGMKEAHPLDDRDIEALGTPFMYNWRWGGLRSSDRILLTLPFGLSGSAAYLMQACAAFGAVPIVAGQLSTEEKLHLMSETRPHAIVSVPSYLHRLRALALQQGFRPKIETPTLRAIFVQAEPFGLEWAQGMREFWGCDLHEWYGSTQMGGNTMGTCEASVIVESGADCRRGVLHNLDHRNLLEIRDPQTRELVKPGETGEVIVTNLHRRLFPCIRFRMADRVRYLGQGVCDCGRNLSAYESGTIGRYDDMIKIKGVNVWPEAVDRILFATPAVEEYQAIVSTVAETGLEQVRIQVEFRDGMDANEVEALLKSFPPQIHANVGVSVSVVRADRGALPRFTAKPRRWSDTRLGREAESRFLSPSNPGNTPTHGR